MTKRHSTKRSLVASILILCLCFTSFVGTTFAWFTDSVTSANNIITAGNLDVELEYSTDMVNWTAVDATTNIFDDEALWEPGYTEIVYLRVSNLGNLALKYKLGIEVADETAGKTKDNVEFKLSDYIEYGVAKDVTAKYADRAAALAAITTAAKLNTAYSEEFHLVGKTATATDTDVYALVVYMPESVGNEVNHNGTDIPEIKLGLSVLATQDTVESDSFNDQYDKDATYVSAATADELKDAIAKGQPVSLTEDITMDAGNFNVAAGTKAVINLGGNDLTVPSSNAYDGYLLLDGDLTITGEGNVAVTQINTREGSKLTLGEGVTIETSNSFAINNSGTTVIDGATINHTGTNHAIQNQGGTLIIDDATVTSTSTSNISTINSTGGTVIINGGTFVHEGSMGSVIEWLYSNEGEIIINGGTFIQKGGDPLASIDYGDAKLTINGGTFDSASYFAQPMQNIVINAGEFKNNAVVVFNPFMSWTIADKYVPATSTATTNADGSITVTVN